MKWLSAIAMILMLAACNGRQEEESPAMEISLMKVPPPPKETPPGSKPGQRKFIKNGNVEFETEDADATRKVIMASVRANNAYVSRDDEHRSETEITYTMYVHVPAKRFDAF